MRTQCSIQHCYSQPYQHLCGAIFWKYGDQVGGGQVNFLRFIRAEIIAFEFVPILIVLCKGIHRLGAHTVHMPVGIDGGYTFLVAVVACRVPKKLFTGCKRY